MDINIKSKDLCDRCENAPNGFLCWVNVYPPCTTCDLKADKGYCKCVTVQINTPCPYFRERDDGR